MPNRILKESICTSDSIDQLTWFEEVLYYRLIVNCDDFGRFDGRSAVIKSRLFPLKDNVTAKSVDAAINKLVSAELVVLYVFEGKPYLHLPSWDVHQQIRAKRSKYPAPEEGMISSDIKCNQMISNDSICSRNPIQSESNPNPNTKHPSVDDVRSYCEERKNGINAQAFVDYYAQQGWKLANGNPLKDWKAAVRNWESRNKKNNLVSGSCNENRGNADTMRSYLSRLHGGGE